MLGLLLPKLLHHVLQVQLGVAGWPEIRSFAQDRGLKLLAAAPQPAPDADPGDGAALQSSSWLTNNVALVLGSEGQGLPEDVLADCRPVAIPMAAGMESLNVAAAGAIFMALLAPALPATLQRLQAALVTKTT